MPLDRRKAGWGIPGPRIILDCFSVGIPDSHID